MTFKQNKNIDESYWSGYHDGRHEYREKLKKYASEFFEVKKWKIDEFLDKNPCNECKWKTDKLKIGCSYPETPSKCEKKQKYLTILDIKNHLL